MMIREYNLIVEQVVGMLSILDFCVTKLKVTTLNEKIDCLFVNIDSSMQTNENNDIDWLIFTLYSLSF